MPDPAVTLETPGAAVPLMPAADQANPPNDARKDELLRYQVAQTAKLVGSSAALDWGHLNAAAAVLKNYSPSEPDLPDQLDVDPDKIKAPALTKQGWVLPTHDARAR